MRILIESEDQVGEVIVLCNIEDVVVDFWCFLFIVTSFRSAVLKDVHQRMDMGLRGEVDPGSDVT